MIRIDTKRLLIRNYEIEDVKDYYDYMCLEYTASQEDFEPFNYQQCKEAVIERLKDDSYMVVELKEEKKVIGDLCYRSRSYETFEIAFDFNVKFEKKGYATESCRALLHFLFKSRDARRVVAECNDTNINSIKLLERLGLRREGHFLEDVWFKKDDVGEPIYISSYYYAILRSEWIKNDNYFKI